MPRPEESIQLRFERHYIPEPNSGCWIWLGATIRSRRGAYYGVMGRSASKRKIQGGSNDLAHRISYELHKGPIKDGKQIDHICANTLCVNPEHLNPDTQPNNIRLGHFRRHGNKCRKGHEFTPENTWVEKSGQRHCRKCHADREAIKRASKKSSRRVAFAHLIKER